MNSPALPLRLAALALVLGAAGSAWAQPVGQPGRGRITPEQWQQVFPEQRQLDLQSHQARIAILQRGERCIRASTSAEALRGCRQEERAAMRDQRRSHRDQMRQLFQSRGIELPDWGKRGEGRGWGPGRG